MRPGAEFVSMLAAAPGPGLSNFTAAVHSPTMAAVHSPVVLFVQIGLVIMLGCIAATLIMLICFQNTLNGGRDGQATGAGDAENGSLSGTSMPALLVVMAGEGLPTFLATSCPLSSPPAATVELAATT